MTFFDRLTQETEVDRVGLYTAPIIAKALNNQITLDEYIAFLTEA